MAYFPDAIKTFPTWVDKDPAQGIDGTDLDKAHVEPITEEIEAIEETLGTNPEGTDTTVKERLSRMELDATLYGLLGGI